MFDFQISTFKFVILLLTSFTLFIGTLYFFYDSLLQRRTFREFLDKFTKALNCDKGDEFKELNERKLVVDSLYIYPIKSCRGTKLTECEYTERGFKYDRNWMIVDSVTHKFCTAREFPQLVLVEPTVDREKGTLTIRIPKNYHPQISIPPSLDYNVYTVPLDPPTITSQTQDFTDRDDYFQDVQIWKSITDGFHVKCPSPSPSSSSLNFQRQSLDEALSEYLKKSVILIRKGPKKRLTGSEKIKYKVNYGSGIGKVGGSNTGFADGFPFLFVTFESFNQVLNKVKNDAEKFHKVFRGDSEKERDFWRRGGEMEMVIERFRPNVVIKGAEEWEEDGWLNVIVGDSKVERDQEKFQGREMINLVTRCGRCQLPNVDPSTGIPSKTVPYKILSTYRRVDPTEKYSPCFGVNAVPEKSQGIIKVGDVIKVIRRGKRREGGGWIRPEDL